RFARRGILLGEHDIAEVDSRAQLAGGGEIVQQVGIHFVVSLINATTVRCEQARRARAAPIRPPLMRAKRRTPTDAPRPSGTPLWRPAPYAESTRRFAAARPASGKLGCRTLR